MNIERILVAKAVFAGQLPAHYLTAEEMVELESQMMDVIMDRKAAEGKIVFSVDNIVH